MEGTLQSFNLTTLESALESLRQALPLSPNHPLVHFRSIRVLPIPGVDHAIASDFQVFQYLVRTIRAALRRQREQSKSYSAVTKVAKVNAFTKLKQDFHCANRELEAWSLLYYRYVRVDLDLSIGQIAALVGQTRRTLERRQKYGLTRILNLLLQHEAKFLESNRLAYLRTCLPAAPVLYGRDDTLIWAVNYFSTVFSTSLCISGAPGVGKSSLALGIAHRLIEHRSVDNVVWLENPPSDISQLCGQVASKLGLGVGRSELVNYLAKQRVFIVLDSISPPIDNYLEEAFQLFQDARLLIVTERQPPHFPNLGHLSLPPLDKDAALEWLYSHIFIPDTQYDEFVDRFQSSFEQSHGSLKVLKEQLLKNVSAGRSHRTNFFKTQQHYVFSSLSVQSNSHNKYS
jgi:hypothetical protein